MDPDVDMPEEFIKKSSMYNARSIFLEYIFPMIPQKSFSKLHDLQIG